jgi:diguanylate cyclase (GGDEF)-like protein/PAS domain S-box-containing protein
MLQGQGETGFFRQILDSLHDGVYYVNRQRQITYWNQAAEGITGYASSEVLGSRCSDNLLRHVDGEGNCLCLGSCPLAATLEDGEARAAAVFLHHKAGHRLPVAVRISPLRNPAGEIVGAVEIFHDNSEEVATLARLRDLEETAYLDALTGIANRKYLELFLAAKLNEFQRHGWAFGLILADVDLFKTVNDTFGHTTGDQVLKMVAQTLASNCRSFDLVGRWGGEEFLCVIGHAPTARHLHRTAERLRHLVQHSWVSLGELTIRVTVSLGATLARPEDTIPAMIQRADALLYRSKAGGRNCVCLG